MARPQFVNLFFLPRMSTLILTMCRWTQTTEFSKLTPMFLQPSVAAEEHARAEKKNKLTPIFLLALVIQEKTDSEGNIS
jgi:hypothetical protein